MTQCTLPPVRTILSLCDLTGEWPRPYREAGYEVIALDLQRGEDVRLLEAAASCLYGRS